MQIVYPLTPGAGDIIDRLLKGIEVKMAQTTILVSDEARMLLENGLVVYDPESETFSFPPGADKEKIPATLRGKKVL